jgi:hypothetical protein
MSNALAIAAVTATLRSLIEAGVETDTSISGVSVTTRPLDTAREPSAANQLNLFLYHAEVNPNWRNMDIPRATQPSSRDPTPLPLNLYYLVTAYHGKEEDGAVANGRLLGSNRLLGLAMSALHDHAVLDAEAINNNIPPADQVDFPFTQVERVRITPHPISTDEISKLWSSFQTEYRMSVAYEVSVVLIESTKPRRAALPVLRRGANQEGVFVVPIAAPSLLRVEAPNRKPAAEFGDLLTVEGDNLHSEGLAVQFHHSELETPLTLAPEPGRTSRRLAVQLPNLASDPAARAAWPAGVYILKAIVERPPLPTWTSNGLPFGLAPQIISRGPASAPAGNVTVTITCAPQIKDGQRVRLLFGDREIEPDSISTPASPTADSTLVFEVTGAAAGAYPLRLRVEGVDSLPVDFSLDPPGFDADQVITIT